MRILLVHGVGHSEADPNYYASWKAAIAAGLKSGGCPDEPTFIPFLYDDLFDKHYDGPGTYAAAFAELMASAAEHAVLDPIQGAISDIFHRSRDFVYGGDTIRWHVGMVAQLVVETSLRKDLRDRLVKTLSDAATDTQNGQIDIVAAHSLGSLITFDLLHNDARAASLTPFHYLTFGAQINNTFVRSHLWPGRMVMPSVRSWTHLYNPKDPVLTASIAIPDQQNFHQFIAESAAGHSPITTADGPGYLDNPVTQQMVWPILAQAGRAPAAREFRRQTGIATRALERPRRRALLIGINNYPDPANRLDGCINDTFLMSSVLQERGFDARDIRVVHNQRATAAGIRERLAWLLDGVGDGMERVLFYSGHGAQLPTYDDSSGVVDHVDECLVPYDFAWTSKTAITDKDFYHLYSDLPFSAKFFAIFDCCHAGGLTRDGSHRARGISPPDDIRHRVLRWNAAEQMWEDRAIGQSLNPRYGGTAEDRQQMMGKNGVTFRLGRGMALRRTLSKTQQSGLANTGQGLYLPVLMEACRDDQLSYEYKDGATSYGAFTFAMVKNLRAAKTATFSSLVKRTAKTLQTLSYDQSPQLVGPKSVIGKRIPGAK